jgi:hypothetical protein
MAVCAWTPDGNIGQFFVTVAKHMPPPPDGFQPPILWGNEEHVRGLFEGTGLELGFEETAVEFVADSAQDFLAEYEAKLPPMVAAKATLGPEGKWEALRSDLERLYDDHNLAHDDGYRAPGEYLVTTRSTVALVCAAANGRDRAYADAPSAAVKRSFCASISRWTSSSRPCLISSTGSGSPLTIPSKNSLRSW